MDNVYVLKHIIQNRKSKGETIAIFLDLKAAFDTEDRENL